MKIYFREFRAHTIFNFIFRLLLNTLETSHLLHWWLLRAAWNSTRILPNLADKFNDSL